MKIEKVENLILTSKEAEVLNKALELVDEICRNSDFDGELDSLSASIHEKLSYLLDNATINIIKQKKEEIILSEKEVLTIEDTLNILFAVLTESENEDTLALVDDAKIALIELLNNVFKRK